MMGKARKINAVDYFILLYKSNYDSIKKYTQDTSQNPIIVRKHN